MRFWDSSAVVPLLLREAASARLLKLHRRDRAVMVWWGTEVECVSALARLERDGGIGPRMVAAALRRLGALGRAWYEIQPSAPVRETALRLLRVHPLRAADALQLAAAHVGAEGHPPTLELVCLDARLAQAAEREGFPVLGAR